MTVERIGEAATLYLGDYASLVDSIDTAVDMCVVDPPYGTTCLKWDYKFSFEKFWKLVKPLLKPNAITAMFCSGRTYPDVYRSNEKEFYYELVMEKSVALGFLYSKKKPLRAHELIAIFCNGSKSKSIYNPQIVPRDTPKQYSLRGEGAADPHGIYEKKKICPSKLSTFRYPRDVIKVKSDQCRIGNVHPTKKPSQIMRWLIRTYSNEGDIVFDPLMGSGTAGVEAIRNGRKFIGIELEKEYYELAVKDIRQAYEERERV